MKKYLTIFILLITTGNQLFSQGYTQNADGQSSLLFKGIGIGFDIAKTDLSFGINNLTQKIEAAKAVKFVFGGDIKVKNEGGIGSFFRKGEIVPFGELKAFAGITFANTRAIDKSEENKALEQQRAENKELQQKLKKDFIAKMENLIEEKSFLIEDAALRKIFVDTLTAQLKTEPELIFHTRIKPAANDTKLILENKVAIKKEAEKELNEFNKARAAGEARQINFKALKDSLTRTRFTIFGFGGLNSLAFKRFKGLDMTNLANSFEDISSRGGKIGVGVNFRWRNLWIGATYSYVEGNNFNGLTQKEYNWNRTSEGNSQTLVEEKTISAYSGKFNEIDYNELVGDIVYNVNLGDSGRSHLLISPYIKGQLFSRDTSLLPNKTNIGVGLYFFKNNSKFLGGLYIELPDVNNNAEKRKPEADQNLRPAHKRLSFGVTGRINLGSFFTWQ